MNGNTENRRQLIRSQTSTNINGIDYVEVKKQPPSPLPNGVVLQLAGAVLLQVVFLRDLTAVPAPAEIRVEGGTLGLPLAIGSVFRDAQERRVLWVEVQPGDRAPYTLSLRAGPTDTRPPAGFDPILARAGLRFLLSGEADADPVSAPLLPPVADPPDPRIDYLARDYAALRQRLLERLAVTAPGHFSGHPADLGTVVVEALAQRGDELSYLQDAIGTEAYLGTAHRRVSVRRHARLLDYTFHEGCNARALVCCDVTQGVTAATLREAIQQAPVRLLTRTSRETLLAADEAERLVWAGSAQAFELLPEGVTDLLPQHGSIPLYDFGLAGAELAAGETVAALVSTAGAPLALSAGDLVIFDRTPVEPGAPGYAHAVRLVRADPRTDPLTQQPYVEIEWLAADALPAPMPLRQGGFTLVARGNVLVCDQGRTIRAEVKPSGARLPRAELPVRGLVHAVELGPQARSLPAALLLVQDPRRAVPAIRCTDPSVPEAVWRPRSDLIAATAGERAFVVELENDGTGWLRFGDGRRGRQPPARLSATLRVTDGAPGDVPAEGLVHLVSGPAFAAQIRSVRNPLPAQGACPREPIEAAQLRAPHAFRVQERAVTGEDYATQARRFDDVSDAACVLRRYGSFDTAVIGVVRQGSRPLTPTWAAGLRAALEPFRLIGHTLHITEPGVVRPRVRLTAYLMPGADERTVAEALRAAFSDEEFPGRQRGFFHPDRFSLGQPLYLSHILEAAMAVPGVRFLDVSPAPQHLFRRDEPGVRDEFERGVLEVGPLELVRVAPGAPSIEFLIARMA